MRWPSSSARMDENLPHVEAGTRFVNGLWPGYPIAGSDTE